MWRIGLFLKKCRQETITLLERIPRKLQVCINLLLILFLLLALYVVIGCPTFTDEQAYRRIEKANLVGPAEILGYEMVTQQSRQQRFVLAETADSVILSAVTQPANYHSSDFFCLQKTGDITVTAAPQELHWEYGGELTLTMIVFDTYPQAVRAELDFELFWERGRTDAYRDWFYLTASRKNNGYFRFDFEFNHDEFSPDPQAEAIYQLSQVLYYPNDWTLPEDAYPAVVRLYDAEDKLIVEKKMQLFTQN